MSQMRSQRPVTGAHGYNTARTAVYGTGALKNAAYAPSKENAAPRARVQENAQTNPHRQYFESAQPIRQPQVRTAPRKKALSKSMIMLVSLFAVVVVMGFMWIAQLVTYWDLRGDVKQAQTQLDELKAYNGVMTEQLNTLKEGERIRTYAVNKLGMVAPGKGEERTISIILPRTQEEIAHAQEEMHYTLLDVLVDMLWF